jgi:hypothetical protein
VFSVPVAFEVTGVYSSPEVCSPIVMFGVVALYISLVMLFSTA